METLAIVPQWAQRQRNPLIAKTLAVLLGFVLIALFARIYFRVSFTPVPITGQSFAIALLTLGWGSRLAFITFLVYLAAGWFGLPIFSMGKSGSPIGPTFGYLVGMGLATFLVGHLSDRGFARKFSTAFLCCVLNSTLILGCGVIGLSFYFPADRLLAAGVLPFLPGDLIKNTLASLIGSLLSRRFH